MADDLPFAAFADDDPGDLDLQRLGIRVDDKGRRARDVDHVGRGVRSPDIGELNSRLRPARQRVEIGGHAIIAAVEGRVRAEKERVP